MVQGLLAKAQAAPAAPVLDVAELVARAEEETLLDESSLLVFRIWMQLGGLSSPPTPQEIADMDAPLAMDIALLLRLYRRAQESEEQLAAMFGERKEKERGVTDPIFDTQMDPLVIAGAVWPRVFDEG